MPPDSIEIVLIVLCIPALTACVVALIHEVREHFRPRSRFFPYHI